MLIIPLHRPLTWQTFPFATAVLILINVFVFLFLQSADFGLAALQRRVDAAEFYAHSELPVIELPAYRAALEQRGLLEPLQMLDDIQPPDQYKLLAMLIDDDPQFLREFDQDGHFESAAAHAAWRAARERYETRRGTSFTERWMLHFGQWQPLNMLSAAFLHGGFGHLIGNMIFLALFGMLVELALGPARFSLLYLIGAFGASVGSLLWRGDSVGGGLGASGAIAALMGAFAVIWAGRQVRVFYWFFVLFNYVRVPALWLLPLWLGWEVYNLIFNGDAGIGFDAHASGIIAGALCALAFRHLGWVHLEPLDAADTEPDRGERLRQAMQDLGALRLEAAETGLRALLAEQPDDASLQLALLRCARLGGQRQRAQELAQTLMQRNDHARELIDQQLATLRELAHLKLQATPAARCRLAERLLATSRFDEAEFAVDGLRSGDDARLPAIWLALANAHLAARRFSNTRSVLEQLLRGAPDSAEAAKARFLLSQLPPDRRNPRAAQEV